jgi:hypothetical protein
VYTPQVVVDGVEHAVGSEQDSIKAAISRADQTLSGKRVPLTVHPDGDQLAIVIGDAPGSTLAKATVLLVDFKSSAEVDIHHGENGGRHVTYYHVVRDLRPIGAWVGKAETLKVPIGDAARNGADGCAVLLQAGEVGPILAAAEVTGW